MDLFYPPICEVCQEILTDGRALCDSCSADLPRLTAPFCQICGEPFQGAIDDTFSCPNCRNLRLSFDFARPATARDKRTMDMIHGLKYERKIHLAPDLGRLAAEAFSDPRLASALAGKWPIIPVPLHRRRFHHRHFNQAEEISRELSNITGLPILKALRRIRNTEHQTTLARAQRLENLRGAFAVTRKGRRHVSHSPVGAVLVDDVFTTGSTVEECAKTLRRAGMRNIVVVTVMRG